MLEHTHKSILLDYVNKQKISTFESENMVIFSKRGQGAKAPMSIEKNNNNKKKPFKNKLRIHLQWTYVEVVTHDLNHIL